MSNETSEHIQGDVFLAIAPPVRRQILDRLADGEESVSQLAEPFGMSRPAVSLHLRVLHDARLVTEQRHGRERHYRLQPQRLNDVRAWMRTCDRFWHTHLASRLPRPRRSRRGGALSPASSCPDTHNT